MSIVEYVLLALLILNAVLALVCLVGSRRRRSAPHAVLAPALEAEVDKDGALRFTGKVLWPD